MSTCGECGFVYDSVPRADVPSRLRALPARYTKAVRAAVDAGLARTRPRPATWSALEYTCHVRDVLDVQLVRLLLALEEETPLLEPMGRDERAINERYNEQDEHVVLEELDGNAERLAAAFASLDETEWARTAIYNRPEAAERSMLWIARNTIHEGLHHLQDVEAGVAALKAQREAS